MGKTQYDKPYAILQEHVNFPLVHASGATESEKVVVLNVTDQDIDMIVEAIGSESGANQNQTTVAEVCIYELTNATTGGTDYVGDIVSANLDRSAGRDLIGLEVLQDVAYDLTDQGNGPAVRLMREGTSANNRAIDKQIIQGVHYALKRNTQYLFRSEIKDGDTGNSISTVIFDLILLNENGGEEEE